MAGADRSPSEQEPFVDRADAGRRLADRLRGFAATDPVVVALPRGGVPVASEIARALDAPLELLAVRKLAAPGNPEYGIGAIAEDGTRVVDPEATSVLGLRNGQLAEIVARERAELRRRVRAYRGRRRALSLEGRAVIVVDDGVATGFTDAAAIRAVRRQRPAMVVLAVPVCSSEGLELLREEADRVVCLRVPRVLHGVSRWYLDFGQVSDQEVIDALRPGHRAAARPQRLPGPAPRSVRPSPDTTAFPRS